LSQPFIFSPQPFEFGLILIDLTLLILFSLSLTLSHELITDQRACRGMSHRAADDCAAARSEA